MRQKELIIELSNRLGASEKEIETHLSVFTDTVSGFLSEGDSLLLQGFGVFEVKKKDERISLSPNGKKYLVPPKLTPLFRPNIALKEQINSKDE